MAHPSCRCASWPWAVSPAAVCSSPEPSRLPLAAVQLAGLDFWLAKALQGNEPPGYLLSSIQTLQISWLQPELAENEAGGLLTLTCDDYDQAAAGLAIQQQQLADIEVRLTPDCRSLAGAVPCGCGTATTRLECTAVLPSLNGNPAPLPCAPLSFSFPSVCERVPAACARQAGLQPGGGRDGRGLRHQHLVRAGPQVSTSCRGEVQGEGLHMWRQAAVAGTWRMHNMHHMPVAAS